jgi:hypothetical protein
MAMERHRAGFWWRTGSFLINATIVLIPFQFLAAALFSPVAAHTFNRSVTDPSPIHRRIHPHPSVEVSPIVVPFGDVEYDIPRNYLVAVTKPNHRSSNASFTLYVLLPSLVPRTPTTAPALDLIGWHDQLRALVQYKFTPRSAEDLLRFYLRTSKTADDDYTLIGEKYRLYKRPFNVPHEIYTTNTPHGLLLFTCNDQNDFNIVKYPSCRVSETLSDNVGITYNFGRDHLLEAADIDEKLRALVTSFVKK